MNSNEYQKTALWTCAVLFLYINVYTEPYDIMASATLANAAILAPAT